MRRRSRLVADPVLFVRVRRSMCTSFRVRPVRQLATELQADLAPPRPFSSALTPPSLLALAHLPAHLARPSISSTRAQGPSAARRAVQETHRGLLPRHPRVERVRRALDGQLGDRRRRRRHVRARVGVRGARRVRADEACHQGEQGASLPLAVPSLALPLVLLADIAAPPRRDTSSSSTTRSCLSSTSATRRCVPLVAARAGARASSLLARMRADP